MQLPDHALPCAADVGPSVLWPYPTRNAPPGAVPAQVERVAKCGGRERNRRRGSRLLRQHLRLFRLTHGSLSHTGLRTFSRAENLPRALVVAKMRLRAPAASAGRARRLAWAMHPDEG